MVGSAPPPVHPPTPPRRVRLSAEARREQILNAALAEFSKVGFEGATMDRIAQRIGLTKAGLYAHFKSKDQLLEALLVSTIFNLSAPPDWQLQAGETLETAVDGYLERIYRLVLDPQLQATFRLLVIESGRSPERVQRWSQEIFRPYTLRRQEAVTACVTAGLMPDSSLSRQFSLASSPALQALFCAWFVAPEDAEPEIRRIRAWHREMLLTMLHQEDTP